MFCINLESSWSIHRRFNARCVDRRPLEATACYDLQRTCASNCLVLVASLCFMGLTVACGAAGTPRPDAAVQATVSPPLTITSVDLPEADAGIPYTAQLSASGGT